jgi:hypothetical protein
MDRSRPPPQRPGRSPRSRSARACCWCWLIRPLHACGDDFQTTVAIDIADASDTECGKIAAAGRPLILAEDVGELGARDQRPAVGQFDMAADMTTPSVSLGGALVGVGHVRARSGQHAHYLGRALPVVAGHYLFGFLSKPQITYPGGRRRLRRSHLSSALPLLWP